VLTLPLGVLQACSVRVEPELVDKRRAVQNLRMGAVIKLALVFDAPFWWPEGREQLGFLQTPSEPFPVWWTSYPVLSPLLVGWAGGPPAEALSNLADDQIVERALDSLGRVFGLHRRRLASRLVAWCVHNWQCDPLALGAYSYVAVGGAGSQRALARPVAGTLFFAGEATEWSGHHATVHGAIMSGERAARELLSATGDAPGTRRPTTRARDGGAEGHRHRSRREHRP
jgi:monoamine oxidase